MNLLLVSPATPATFWSYKHVVPFASKRAAYPPLGLLTVGALLPKTWNVRLVDLMVSRLGDDDIAWADYIFVSAMIVHEQSARQVAARCNAQGKPIVAGGPLFTTGHERFPEIRHFVLGEAEEIIPELVEDISAGNVKPYYQASRKPDMTRSPVPRWDLIRFSDYATMLVQYSRGCPFDCEFCDIIVMYGRVPRAKTPAQLIREIDALVDAGWNGSIFIVDDNFIGNKVKAKALLHELVAWRKRRSVATTFMTQASLNVVDVPGMLELMVRAGFKKVFIGIETPEEKSLTECAKVQNLGRDMVASVKAIQRAGIEVMGGFIVGFDSDTESVFERQWRFIQEAGIAQAMVGLLTALPETRLFQRLKQEGRILRESTGNNLDAVVNFLPKLDREVLTEGYRSLVKRLYAPSTYYRRARTFLQEYRVQGPRRPLTGADVRAFARSLWTVGIRTRGRREYWKFVVTSLLFYPRAFGEAMTLAIMGHHFRKVAASL